jgi:hypothetical protein
MTNDGNTKRAPRARVILATLFVAANPLACGEADSELDVGSAADETSGEQSKTMPEASAAPTAEPGAVVTDAPTLPEADEGELVVDGPVHDVAGEPGPETDADETASVEEVVVAMDPPALPLCTPEDYADGPDAGDYPDCVRG